MPLRLRLAIWNALIIVAAISLLSVFTYQLEERGLREDIDDSLRSQADNLAAIYEVRGTLPSQARQHVIPQPSVFAAPAFHVQILNADGIVVERSATLGARPLPIAAESLRLAGDDQDAFETVTVDGHRVRLFTGPIFTDEDFLGYVQVARSLEAIEDALVFLRRGLVGAGVALVALSVLVVWLLAGVALQPIARMTQAAEAIALSMQLDQRLAPPRSHDEVGRLVETFNRMMDRVEAAFAAQRRFVGDASHELRTPLTTVLGNLHLLRRRGRVTQPEMREALQDAILEAERMSRLTQGLLALARADAGQELPRLPVRLDHLVRAVYRDAQAMAQGVEVHLERADPVEVMGDVDSLKQLLLILVQNGLKYTDPGGSVTLDLRYDSEAAVLSVSDTGQGISEEDLPHIFERFYRARGARSSGGTGLGLAIARWIAEEHGATIDVRSTPGQGTTFAVRLKDARRLPIAEGVPVPAGEFITAS